MAYFLAVYFGVSCVSYYDDYGVVEPLYSVHFVLDKGKHVRVAYVSSGELP